MVRDQDTRIGGARRQFPSTRHSLIAAAMDGKGDLARDALGQIIAVYWKPAYKYVRLKHQRGNEEAKDLVQGFFAALVESGILKRFDPSLGSFRTYLRACLDHFVMKQDEAAGRLKRGGHYALVPLDFDAAERELPFADRRMPPDELFHREWQRHVLALAINDLREHSALSGKELWFRLFEEYDLADEPRPRYEDLANAHGVAATTVTNALAWARRELRRFALERISAVTVTRSEFRAEARQLFA
jgi:RNA polymerase sigma factor (sigma-70 family)